MGKRGSTDSHASQSYQPSRLLHPTIRSAPLPPPPKSPQTSASVLRPSTARPTTEPFSPSGGVALPSETANLVNMAPPHAPPAMVTSTLTRSELVWLSRVRSAATATADTAAWSAAVGVQDASREESAGARLKHTESGTARSHWASARRASDASASSSIATVAGATSLKRRRVRQKRGPEEGCSSRSHSPGGGSSPSRPAARSTAGRSVAAGGGGSVSMYVKIHGSSRVRSSAPASPPPTPEAAVLPPCPTVLACAASLRRTRGGSAATSKSVCLRKCAACRFHSDSCDETSGVMPVGSRRGELPAAPTPSHPAPGSQPPATVGVGGPLPAAMPALGQSPPSRLLMPPGQKPFTGAACFTVGGVFIGPVAAMLYRCRRAEGGAGAPPRLRRLEAPAGSPHAPVPFSLPPKLRRVAGAPASKAAAQPRMDLAPSLAAASEAALPMADPPMAQCPAPHSPAGPPPTPVTSEAALEGRCKVAASADIPAAAGPPEAEADCAVAAELMGVAADEGAVRGRLMPREGVDSGVGSLPPLGRESDTSGAPHRDPSPTADASGGAPARGGANPEARGAA
eukprot:scaffold3607_cov114-Isochrysis_galbana.AAC.8